MSPFFYTTLTKVPPESGSNYEGVRRWMKGKDLFSIPYIVLPIIQEKHWLVAFICHLHNLRLTASDIVGETELLSVLVPMSTFGQPTIIVLASIGKSHENETAHLRDFIKEWAKDNRSIAIRDQDLRAITTQGLPKQSNHFDCGPYLTGYLDAFAKKPVRFLDKVLREELDLPAFNASTKRAELRAAWLDLRESHKQFLERYTRSQRRG